MPNGMGPPVTAGSSAPSSRWFVLNAWRGELGLYRTAYGLGGIGFSVVAVVAELTLDRFAQSGRAAVWLSTIAAVAGELAFAWFLGVATWRALRRGRPDGRRYGRIGAGFALLFVGLQIGTTLAGMAVSMLGVEPAIEMAVLHHLIRLLGGDPEGVDQLMKVLGG